MGTCYSKSKRKKDISIDRQSEISNRRQTEVILKQQSKSLCRIITKDGKFTAFLCKIPTPVLITNNHILDESQIEPGKKINIIFIDEEGKKSLKIIEIDDARTTYTIAQFNGQEIDTTIIEIRIDEDDLKGKEFIEIDKDLMSEKVGSLYDEKEIYQISYGKEDKKAMSIGVINKIEKKNKSFTLFHTCGSEQESSGSPIIILSNHKVIGINRKNFSNEKLNKATLLQFPIKKFLAKLEQKNLYFDKKIINKDDKKIPNSLKKSLEKQENVFRNTSKYSKFMKKIGEKVKNITKKKKLDELLMNENNFVEKKQELNIIEKNLTDPNKYNKNFWTITLRNTPKNGEYESNGYINTGTKYQPLYSIFKMDNNIEYVRSPYLMENKKQKINNNKKAMKTPKLNKTFSKFIYLSKIKQNLKKFDSIKTLGIKGKNLLDFEDERETSTNSKKIMYNLKYIDYIIMCKKKDEETETNFGNLNDKEIKFNFKEIYDDRTFAEDFHKTDYFKNINITTKHTMELD